MFQEKSQQVRRIRLTTNEARTLPADTRAVRVYEGGAWLSHRGEDVLLDEGETLHLHSGHHGTVVTALGKRALVLELLT